MPFFVVVKRTHRLLHGFYSRSKYNHCTFRFCSFVLLFLCPCLVSVQVQRPDGVEARSGGIGSMAVTWH